MFIINPLSGQRMDNLFSTHPATENRIAALQEMAARDGPRRVAGDARPARRRACPAPVATAAGRRGASGGPWG